MNDNEDIVKEIANRTGLPKTLIRVVLLAFTDVANETLAERGNFRIPNILTIKTRTLPERKARDPQTGSLRMYPRVDTLTAKFSSRFLKHFKNSHRGGSHE